MKPIRDSKHHDRGFQRDKPLNSTQRPNCRTRMIATAIIFFSYTLSQGQTLNENWRADLVTDLHAFLSCTVSKSNRTQCASFIESSITTVFRLGGHHPQTTGNIIPVSFTSNLSGDHWSLLGKAYEQGLLNRAQEMANSHQAVIAVYQDSGGEGRHIALILPGALHYSGSWGCNVPNSASFFLATPEKSYVEKGLSYAFTKNMVKDVTLYSWEQ